MSDYFPVVSDECYHKKINEEIRRLDEEVNQLFSFINNARFDALDADTQCDLVAQLGLMKAYKNMLELRIESYVQACHGHM